jgi:hypothetical protein
MKNFYIPVILFIATLIAGCEKESASDAGSSGKGGSTARFTIAHGHLYTVSNQKLKVFSLDDATDPQISDSVDLGFGIETIFPYEDHLFIGTQTGMKIVDISRAGYPDLISEYNHIFSCDPVVVEGNYAYVTLNSLNSWCGRNANQLEIIDISDLYAPRLIKRYPMEGPLGLGIDGDLLFVCDNGLKVYDVTNKQGIKLLYKYQIKANDVIPNGNILLVIGNDGLYQYSYNAGDISLLSKIPVE